MNRLLPVFLCAAGIGLLIAGFAYDMMFAGIPYQDPTPQLTADFEHHSRVASVIMWFGIGLLILGCVSGLIRCTLRRSREDNQKP